MIDPRTLISPTDSVERKQEFLLFCIMSVGKNSDIAASKVELILKDKPTDATPFEYLSQVWSRSHAEQCKTGQYTRVTKAIKQAIQYDVERITLDELTSIHGIGPKTARFFLVHSQGKEHAVLDTHILRWMRGFFPDVPESTPPASHYPKWERLCKMFMKAEFPEHTLLTADLMIWLNQSKRNEST